MNAAELRAQHLEHTLQRMAEELEQIVVGIDVGTLKALSFEGIIRDYVEACERAPFEADTQEHVLPVGIRGG